MAILADKARRCDSVRSLRPYGSLASLKGCGFGARVPIVIRDLLSRAIVEAAVVQQFDPPLTPRQYTSIPHKRMFLQWFQWYGHW